MRFNKSPPHPPPPGNVSPGPGQPFFNGSVFSKLCFRSLVHLKTGHSRLQELFFVPQKIIRPAPKELIRVPPKGHSAIRALPKSSFAKTKVIRTPKKQIFLSPHQKNDSCSRKTVFRAPKASFIRASKKSFAPPRKGHSYPQANHSLA